MLAGLPVRAPRHNRQLNLAYVLTANARIATASFAAVTMVANAVSVHAGTDFAPIVLTAN